MIALGVFAAVTLARRRWKALGNDPDQIADVAVIAVPAGLIGARLYHVITDWNRLYSDGRWWPKAFQIWNGGLGIPGGIFLGAAAGGRQRSRRHTASGHDPNVAAAGRGASAWWQWSGRVWQRAAGRLQPAPTLQPRHHEVRGLRDAAVGAAHAHSQFWSDTHTLPPAPAAVVAAKNHPLPLKPPLTLTLFLRMSLGALPCPPEHQPARQWLS